MAVVLGGVLANTIDTELTKTRDYIANGPIFWKPGVTCSIAQGGTGASTAAGARTALGITAANIPSAAGSNVQADLTFLGARIDNISASTVLSAGGSNVQADLDFLGDRIDGTVSKSGDTMTGHLYLPASSPATSGYTIAYINNDGRVSRGASSERFKDDITPIDPAELGDLFPQLHSFVMKDDTSEPKLTRYGYIAERLEESEALRPFVVYARQQDEDGTWHIWRDDDGNPVPESIDFIGLMLAQIALLHTQLDALTAHIAELEQR